jgi:hypothetical protein
MSVRTRLIVAFLILSVLPLSIVTLYSYLSSVNAFRSAVASESARMAADLQQRLDTVTADLSRQVEELWEPSVANAANRDTPQLSTDVRVVEGIAAVLGDSARLLERVEFRTAPPPAPALAGAAPAPPAAPAAPLPPSSPVVVNLHEAMAEVEKQLKEEGVPPEVAQRLRSLGNVIGPALEAGLHAAGAATRSAATVVSEKASERARARLERARELAVANRRATMAGDAIAVPIVRDGRLVGSVDAQLNLPRTLAMVFGTAHR